MGETLSASLKAIIFSTPLLKVLSPIALAKEELSKVLDKMEMHIYLYIFHLSAGSDKGDNTSLKVDILPQVRTQGGNTSKKVDVF